jgi:hypothetical protein
MGDLIRRTHGETIEIEFALGGLLPLCFCDTNQMETSLLNLVINARDAMPQGGRLRIETAKVDLDEAEAEAHGLMPGPHLILSVQDNGVGMSAETIDRAFEPFFTTKEQGRRTGLGLSMVYGFVKQSKGHVQISSSLGKGTRIQLMLPALAGDIPAPSMASGSDEVPRARGARKRSWWSRTMQACGSTSLVSSPISTTMCLRRAMCQSALNIGSDSLLVESISYQVLVHGRDQCCATHLQSLHSRSPWLCRGRRNER